MPSSANPSSSVSRKFAWLVGGIIAAGLLWTFGWYFFAAKIEENLPATLAQIVGPGAEARCSDADVRGYPFRVGLFCETVSYSNAGEGVAATAGAFRSAAQVYRPQHAVAEIDGPFVMETSGMTFRADWQLLKASVQAVTDGLDRGSLETRNTSLALDSTGLKSRLALQADRITAHARRNGADLDVAVYGENLSNTLVTGLNTKAVKFEATLSGQSSLLEMPFRPLEKPYAGTLHRLQIDLDETSSLELAGPIQVGADGRLSGNLELTIGNVQRLSDLVADFNPDSAELIRRFGPMIAALDTRPGDAATTLPLTIRNGQVSLGIIPLGELPAL